MFHMIVSTGDDTLMTLSLLFASRVHYVCLRRFACSNEDDSEFANNSCYMTVLAEKSDTVCVCVCCAKHVSHGRQYVLLVDVTIKIYIRIYS